MGRRHAARRRSATGASAQLRELRQALRDSEALPRLVRRVAQCLADAGSVPAALSSVMRIVCEASGWDCGRYFAVLEPAGELRCTAWWSRDRPALRNYLEASRDLRIARGEGLAGRVWQTGRPLWVADVTRDARVARPLLAEGAGLRSAIVFPVGSDTGIVGVMVFSSRAARRPEVRMLHAMEVVGSLIDQHLRHKRAEEQQRRFRAGMDASADMILLVDPRTMRYVDVNESVCRTLGYTRDEMLAMGPQDILPVAREDLQRVYERFVADPSSIHSMNSVYRCKDGSGIPFESYRRLLPSEDGPLIVAISRDMRTRLQADEALRESEARFRSLTHLSSDFFWETDDLHNLTHMQNAPKYSDNTTQGVTAGRAPWDIPSLKPDAAGWAAHRANMEARRPFRNFEYARFDAEGRTRFFSVSGEPRFAADGSFAGYRGVGHEVTEIVEARERIAALAYSDPLTGLSNRTSLGPALEHAVERARRNRARVALVYLDLDGFKQVNDMYGHDAGDQVLVEAAQRLRRVLRSSDLVARLGGDEFVVVLEDIASNADVESVVRKLIAEIGQPCAMPDGRAYGVTASAGVSLFPDDADTPRELLQHADAAMYRAKQESKNALRVYARAGAG